MMESGIKEIWTNGKTTLLSVQGKIYVETYSDYGERYVVKTPLTRKWFNKISPRSKETLWRNLYDTMTWDWVLGSEESEEILWFLFNEYFEKEIDEMEDKFYTKLCSD